MKSFYELPEIEILSMNGDCDVIRTSGLKLDEIGEGDGDEWDEA